MLFSMFFICCWSWPKLDVACSVCCAGFERLVNAVSFYYRKIDFLNLLFVLQVYLDISFLRDPEIQLQLLIIPSTFAYLYSAEAAGAPSYSDFPPPVPSSFCGYPAPNVSQGLNTRGFENQLPPKVTPSGLPTLGHQALTAPPLFREEEPPSYQSLWPPANTHSYTGSNKK